MSLKEISFIDNNCLPLLKKTMNSTQKYRKTKKGLLTNIYGKQKERSIQGGFNIPEYSLSEFQDRFINDKKFNRLYNEWVVSKYSKQFIPSFDRISYKKGYSFSNITLMTWAENRYKQRMELKMHRARAIGKFMGENLQEKYKSVSDAVKKTSLPQGNISSCLSGKRKTCGGYFWKYL